MSSWYAVTRRYTVEDVVYVEADSKTHARAKVEDGNYEDVTMTEIVSPTTMRKARQITFEELPSDVQFRVEFGHLP